MQIKEFCELYGVDRGEVDYWTRIGLLHPRVMENGYRNYSGRAEDEVKIISVAQYLDYPGPIEDKVKRLYDMDAQGIKKTLDRLKHTKDCFNKRFSAAFDYLVNEIERRG